MTDPTEHRKSWWETLPGVLAGLATLIGAVGGLAAIFIRPDPEPPPKPEPDSKPAHVSSTLPAETPKPDPCKLPFAERPISCLGSKK